MQIINCEASVWYIQSDKLSIWSIGLPPPLFNDQFLHSETNAKVFFSSRYEFIKWLFCTEKGIIMHALTIRHFYMVCHHLFYARRKVIISFWSYFINEWMLFLWMVSVWNRLCIFYFFFLCEVEARLKTPSMIYSRFLWLLLLLFWAFLAPMQSGYLYKAPSFCIYKKKPKH